jgi:hypothetical protein
MARWRGTLFLHYVGRVRIMKIYPRGNNKIVLFNIPFFIIMFHAINIYWFWIWDLEKNLITHVE